MAQKIGDVSDYRLAVPRAAGELAAVYDGTEEIWSEDLTWL